MALAFNTKPVTVIKARLTTGEYISIPGCTDASVTPAVAAAQINKVLAVGGKEIVADTHMTRTRSEEVIIDE